jgi:serine protease Do
VIGINSQIYSPGEGSVGIGFAIPAETAKPIIETMIKGGKVQRGYLGVGRQPVDEDIAASSPGLTKDVGELISRVEPGQAGAKAGLKQGDVVTAVNGQEVNPEETLSYLIANIQPGGIAKLNVIRDGKPIVLTAIVGNRPTEEELAAAVAPGGGTPNGGAAPNGGGTAPAPELRAGQDLLGVQVNALTPGVANSLGLTPGSVTGVVVGKVDASSDAAAKGLLPGDIISSVNKVGVATPAEFDAQIKAAKAAGKTTLLIYITRPKQGSLFLAIKIKGN